ncbi:hypothetical protein [Hymenobacter siberiensis]|uniref:hypothetical protein n=1 Tax=Hymenobacter siberiensis TaxID=2848396 RepID=UPI001C1E60CA|nr:hypothetical protein [Hymenobacter siberiensis]
MIRPMPPEVLAQLYGQPVQVYQNLNNGQWSVKHRDHPVFHLTECHLSRVTLKVSAKGRAQVRAQNCRQVHAYAHGYLSPAPASAAMVGASYNPHNDVPAFYLRATKQPVYTATAASFGSDKKMYLQL